MKYVKILGVLAVAAASMMAFAASASATTVTSPTGTVYAAGKGIVATSTNSALHGAFVTVSCKDSVVEGTVSDAGGASKTVKGNVNTLTFTNCENGTPTVKEKGTLELHAVNCVAGGYCDGTLTSSAAKVEIHTSIGLCTFTTNATDVGTVTGTNKTGGTAVLDINSAAIPRTGGNFLCGPSGTWTGNYTVSTPDNLWIDA